MLQICKNIRQQRDLAKKTQEEMATLLGVKRTTYANWETNTEPELKILRAISQIFGIDLVILINENDENTGDSLPNGSQRDESILNLSKSSVVLAEANKVLATNNTQLIKLVESNFYVPKGNLSGFSELLRPVIDRMAKAGIGSLWNTENEGQSALDKLLVGAYTEMTV